MKKYNNNNEVALLFKRLFETEDGKDVYDVLCNRFRAPPMTPGSCSDGMALMALTQMRVGEENVIRYIDSLVKREVGRSDTTSDE
jgi:hypothetical protein